MGTSCAVSTPEACENALDLALDVLGLGVKGGFFRPACAVREPNFSMNMSIHVHPCPHHNLFMNISWTCSSMYHWSSIVTCMSSPYMTLLSPVTKTIVARFRRPRGAGILWGDCWCRGHCDPADKLWMVAESKINFGKCWWLMDGCWNLLKPIDLLFWTTTFNLHLFAPFFGSECSESRISQVDPLGMSWWVTPLQIHCFGIY